MIAENRKARHEYFFLDTWTAGISLTGSEVKSIKAGNLDFTGMPACTVVAIGILDNSTGGNLLVHGTLTANKVLDAGDTLRIATGDLDITID